MQAAGLQHRQLLAAAHPIMAGLMQLSNHIQTCSMHVCIGLGGSGALIAGLPAAWTEVCMGHSLSMLLVVTQLRRAAGKDGEQGAPG